MTTRQQKLETLQAIKDGRRTIASLQPPQQYCFEEDSHRAGIYLMNGKEFSVGGYLVFFESKKHTSDTIITITKHLSTQIQGNLTLNI